MLVLVAVETDDDDDINADFGFGIEDGLLLLLLVLVLGHAALNDGRLLLTSFGILFTRSCFTAYCLGCLSRDCRLAFFVFVAVAVVSVVLVG